MQLRIFSTEIEPGTTDSDAFELEVNSWLQENTDIMVISYDMSTTPRDGKVGMVLVLAHEIKPEGLPEGVSFPPISTHVSLREAQAQDLTSCVSRGAVLIPPLLFEWEHIAEGTFLTFGTLGPMVAACASVKAVGGTAAFKLGAQAERHKAECAPWRAVLVGPCRPLKL